MNFNFGPHLIRASEMFYNTKLTFALVNLKPVVPGHVLVIPRRVVERFRDLTQDEVLDMFKSVKLISDTLEMKYKADSMTITIQDGKHAGQTVPHVHVHVMPRRKGDYLNNDEIYKDLGEQTREPRSIEEMAAEAAELRPLFNSVENIWE